MKKIYRKLKDFFREFGDVVGLVLAVAFILAVVLTFIFEVSTTNSKKLCECTVKFQNGEIKTFVCDKIIYNGNFATITVDDIVYKIAYENLEVKIYENTKN